jgi:hypothetical protein
MFDLLLFFNRKLVFNGWAKSAIGLPSALRFGSASISLETASPNPSIRPHLSRFGLTFSSPGFLGVNLMIFLNHEYLLLVLFLSPSATN